jgi:hypothetical protein
MRRIALLGLTILLPAALAGCQQFVGNPTVGMGGFIGDTMTTHLNPNAPAPVVENEKRVRGVAVAQAPLLPEKGEVWPGPPPPIPTLEDVQKMNPTTMLPPPNLSGAAGPVFMPGTASPPDAKMP